MNEAPDDHCPRCGGAFHCGARDPQCACFELKLRPETAAALRAHYRRCVCVRCLVAVDRGEPAGPIVTARSATS